MIRHDEFNRVFRAMLADVRDESKVNAYEAQRQALGVLLNEADALMWRLGAKLRSEGYGEYHDRLNRAWMRAGRRWSRRMVAVIGSPLSLDS